MELMINDKSFNEHLHAWEAESKNWQIQIKIQKLTDILSIIVYQTDKLIPKLKNQLLTLSVFVE